MNNQVGKTDEVRSEWVKPELQVIDSTDAESAFAAASDGATQNS